MSAASILLLCAPSMAVRRSASRVLARELSPDRAVRIWEEAKRLRKEHESKKPRHSLGVNVLLRYFEWDCALFLAATREGVTEETAGRLVEEINWDVFAPAVAVSFSVSRLRSDDLRTRIRWILDAMFRVVFTPPFRRTTLPSTEGVAFDVTACPLAEYFQDRGVPELTRYAACSLDHRMAALWGVRFERTQTIAEGHPFCDFRFRLQRRPGVDANRPERTGMAKGEARS